MAIIGMMCFEDPVLPGDLFYTSYGTFSNRAFLDIGGAVMNSSPVPYSMEVRTSDYHCC